MTPRDRDRFQLRAVCLLAVPVIGVWLAMVAAVFGALP